VNNMTNVQAHRARLQEAGCRRLEVSIGGGMIDQLRDAAKARNLPVWRAVELAVEQWVTGKGGAEQYAPAREG
jgi:hypothetical protein